MSVLSLFVMLLAPGLEERVDTCVRNAIERKDIPGAVILVIQRDQILLRKAYGNRAIRPAEEAMTVDTIFDLASLTKPIATAAAIHRLAQQGKLTLTDPVSKHWPAFAANGKEKVTIDHLLTHTSGLAAGNPVADYGDGKVKAMERIAAMKLAAAPGEKFVYSDIGYLVLGELVERLSGRSLAEFTQQEIFAPLKMNDTRFRPDEKTFPRIAPTTKRGIVHDPRSAKLDGVSGHAGLFSSADDLARFGRMLLNGGELDGVRIFSAETVKRYTEPIAVPGGFRSRGWDVDTGFSAPRGDGFGKQSGFGHTGFTGTSIWVDQPTKTIIIILTNRVHPDDKGNATKLRREVATEVAK